MGESDQHEKNLPINAYLSYRCKNDRDIAARDKLIPLCDKNNINLIFDQNGTEEGDSLTEFMDDLSAARFVFLFLSPEYFQSAYTLYELISIHEQGDLDKRFIFPLRLTETMVTYEWTTAKNYFDNNDAVRNELVRLLKRHTVNVSNLWQRIDAAWQTIIFPHLDKLNVSLESGNAEEKLLDLLQNSHQQVESVITSSTQELHAKIGENIRHILEKKHIPAEQLALKLQLDHATTLKDIAESGILAKPVSAVLDSLYKLSKQMEKQCFARPDAWGEYLYDVEQICGWLLLNTIDPIWWFHNQLSLQRRTTQSITELFNLQHPAYIEVLISRELLQRAQYRLDEFGSIRPESEEHDVLLFDAASTDATDLQLLSPLHKDLRKGNKAPQNVQRLLDDIVITASSLLGARDGKPIYYIVSETYLKMLKSRVWFAETEQKLKGCLQFICCIQAPGNQSGQPCKEEQDLLLEKVANILRLRNTKGTIND